MLNWCKISIKLLLFAPTTDAIEKVLRGTKYWAQKPRTRGYDCTRVCSDDVIILALRGWVTCNILQVQVFIIHDVGGGREGRV